MSDRVFAILLLAICGVIGWQMWHLHVPFAYEPVGPKAFPLILAILMAICCGFLLASPDREVHWPDREILLKSGALILTLLVYASIFEWVGFVFATAGMAIVVSRLFGASWQGGVITGITLGVAGYLLFDRLLEVSLPVGRLWG